MTSFVSFQLANVFRFLGGVTSVLCLCTLSFKTLMPPPPPSPQDDNGCLAKMVNMDNWRNKKYVIWAIAIPSALFGYFVPYVHIVSLIKRH